MFSRKVIAPLAAGLASANAQQWAVQNGTTLTMVLGVGAESEMLGVAAASQNGVGAFIEQYDGSKWTKQSVSAGLIMDAAVSKSLSVAVSMFPILVSTDGGDNFVVSDVIGGLSQSASIFNEGNDIGLVGSFTASKTPGAAVSGVAHSSDSGATWSLSEVPVGMVRYGSFPTKDTWYVTSGMWSDSLSEGDHVVSLSSKLKFLDNSKELKFADGASVNDVSGWWGAISKTTDAGLTWTTVFHSQPEDAYYFNSIDCSSDLHCVAVVEGDDYTACKAFVTFDGGNTWEDTLTSSGVVPTNAVSMMGTSWINESEGWLAGTAKNGRVLSGLFYKTIDGGKTFSLDQSLDDCFPLDIDFGGAVGMAACLSSSGSSGSIAMYK